MSDFLSSYHLDVKAAKRSVTDISPLATILAVVTGKWFAAYGQQQKDDRESGANKLAALEARVQKLEMASRKTEA